MVDGGVHLAPQDGLNRGDGLHARGGAEAVPEERLGRIHLDAVPVGEHRAHCLDLGNVAD